MKFLQSIALAVNLAACAHATPLPQQNGPSPSSSATQPQVSHQSGGDEHIVILSADCPHPENVLNKIDLSSDHNDVQYTYKNSAFQGFAANLHNASVQALGVMDDVSHVERTVSIQSRLNGASVSGRSSSQPASTRGQSPWGLQRVSSASTVSGNPEAVQYTYSFDPTSSLGKGVDLYVVDTGINEANAAFQGRAKSGYSFMVNDTSDGDGHGTHTAGTAAGFPFGLASSANVIAVKVLGSNGAGKSSDTIAGIDYVVQQHDTQKTSAAFTASVMSMSWGLQESSPAINTAIQSASKAGIHVAVAAGNSGEDACGVSPAQLGGPKNPQSAIVTVGSVGQSNAVSSFSNNGQCVDLYAPGENIVSAWTGGVNMVNSLSGTSMSTPHVSGLMAVMCAEDASVAQNPAALKAKMMGLALKGQVAGNTGGTQGLLLNNGVTDGTGVEGLL